MPAGVRAKPAGAWAWLVAAVPVRPSTERKTKGRFMAINKKRARLAYAQHVQLKNEFGIGGNKVACVAVGVHHPFLAVSQRGRNPGPHAGAGWQQQQ